MNLGINQQEAMILQWALEDWIAKHCNDKNLPNFRHLFPEADLTSVLTQLNLIIQLSEE